MNPPSSSVLRAATETPLESQDPLFMTPVAHRRESLRARAGRAQRIVPRLAGNVTASAVMLAAAWEGTAPWTSAGLTLLVLSLSALAAGREPEWRRLLPFMGALSQLTAPGAGLLALLTLRATSGLPDAGAIGTVLAVAASVVVWLTVERLMRRVLVGRQKINVAVIGSARSADSLGRELRLAGNHQYEIVGRVALPGGRRESDGEVPVLGSLDRLGDVVARHDVRLLLMAAEAPRLAVFDEIARSCLNLPVRLHELSGFYEQAFGHVPVGDINAAWFQYIMHPRYRARESAAERVLDVVVALVVGIASLPLIAVLALLIRRDGGPVLFRQVRIGEGGWPFTILKLRTMRVGASAEWAEVGDARITPVGRFLRRTHLDELPQVINVLRGEMSVVGPRPEQPAFVERLERLVPFYTRRHLIKPGVTGWAQVRCGYAGSDIGSTWKVCHDLYYLKHRSLALNLVILGETLRTLVADPQYAGEPSNVAFILAPTRNALDDAGPVATNPSAS
jgi:exopolysaccharide biosynthesis polyprenyl glycosylphosphotransferase